MIKNIWINKINWEKMLGNHQVYEMMKSPVFGDFLLVVGFSNPY